MRQYLVQLVCCLIVLPAAVSSHADTLKERYSRFDSQIKAVMFTDIADARKVDAIAATFQQFHPEPITRERIKDLANDDLMLLLRATNDASFYGRDVGYVKQMLIVTEHLIVKKTITADQIKYQYDTFVRVRLFDDAQRWHKRFPTAAKTTLPTLIDDATIKSGEPSEWVIAADARVATRRRVDLNCDWMMVVVSHPLCGPSGRATKAIYADAALANRLKGRTKWVTPQDSNITIEIFQQLNIDYPDAPVSVVHIANEWPLEKFSSTPIFYFLREGKVVESFSGWPKEGNFEQLSAALARLAKP